MIIEGLTYIWQGDPPNTVDHKVGNVYVSGLDGRPVTNPDLDDLRRRLVHLADKPRHEGIFALYRDAEEEQIELLKVGMYLILDQRPRGVVVELLEARGQALVADFQLRRRLLIEGLVAIQMGKPPRTVKHELTELTRRARVVDGELVVGGQ